MCVENCHQRTIQKLEIGFSKSARFIFIYLFTVTFNLSTDTETYPLTNLFCRVLTVLISKLLN